MFNRIIKYGLTAAAVITLGVGSVKQINKYNAYHDKMDQYENISGHLEQAKAVQYDLTQLESEGRPYNAREKGELRATKQFRNKVLNPNYEPAATLNDVIKKLEEAAKK